MSSVAERIVINTGPLVAFARLGVVDVIGRLPLRFCTPAEVRTELAAGEKVGHPPVHATWLEVIPRRPEPGQMSLIGLDLGEAAVIELALAEGIEHVAIDEWKGRRAARAIGLQVVGSLGLLGRAKHLGLLPSLRAVLEKAEAVGLRYHPELVSKVLEAVGEASPAPQAS